jgi:hypothetical protein
VDNPSPFSLEEFGKIIEKDRESTLHLCQGICGDISMTTSVKHFGNRYLVATNSSSYEILVKQRVDRESCKRISWNPDCSSFPLYLKALNETSPDI